MKDGASAARSAVRAKKRTTAKDMMGEISMHPELTIGFALLWAWTRLAFGTSAYDASPLASANGGDLFGFVLVLGNALGYLAIGVLFKVFGIVPSGRTYLAFIVFAMSAGSALCFATPAIAPIAVDVSCTIGAALVGVGVAFAYVEWGRILGFLGPRRTIAHACAGIIGSAALLVAASILPDLFQRLYLVFAPVAIMLVVGFWAKKSSPKLLRYGTETEFHVPWRLLITVAVIGMAFGVGLETDGLGNYLDPSTIRNALTFVVVAFSLMLSAVLFNMDFNQLIYRVGIPIMAAGCLLFALSDAALPGPPLRSIGGFLFSSGYLFLDLLTWVLLSYIIKHQEISASWIVALVTGFLLLGRSAGSATVQILNVFFDPGTTMTNGLIMVLVYALMLCAILMVNKRNIRIGWGSIRPAENEATGGLGGACRIVGNDHGLTPRETEILMLFAKGYSRETISRTLTLSKETVRTHASNIFKKLGVHSHQELIALVEDQVRMLDD